MIQGLFPVVLIQNSSGTAGSKTALTGVAVVEQRSEPAGSPKRN